MSRSILLPAVLLALVALVPAATATAPVYVSSSYNGDEFVAHFCDGTGTHGADLYAGTQTVEVGTTGGGPLVTLYTVPVVGVRSTGAC